LTLFGIAWLAKTKERNVFLPDLFSIISLMIGLFGGSISTIVVIRHSCDQKVSRYLEETKEKTKEMEAVRCRKESLQEADRYRDRITRLGKSYRTLTLFPSVIFLIWIFLTSFYVSLSVDCDLVFSSCQSNVAPSDVQNPKESLVPRQETESSIRIIIDALNNILKKLLFRRLTLFVITLVDLICVWRAWRNLKGADKQYQAIVTLHKTVVRENTPEFEKT
jgi:hypothetical protein